MAARGTLVFGVHVIISDGLTIPRFNSLDAGGEDCVRAEPRMVDLEH